MKISLFLLLGFAAAIYLVYRFRSRPFRQLYLGKPITDESHEAMVTSPLFQYPVATTDSKITFADVSGCSEAKVELEEVIEFLKNPQKFKELGGRPPKGILLTGGPGNNQARLARAVAGEAGVPFYEMPGCDLVGQYVGIGISRIRCTFAKAARESAAIIFINELDAFAAVETAAGASEREYLDTREAFLAEMDGMGSTSNVIVLSSTYVPEILDPSVVQLGRFDRHIEVNIFPILAEKETLIGPE